MPGSSEAVLVTVRGPQRVVDLELPADVPINALVSLLIEICAPSASNTHWAAPAYWGLGPEGSSVLPAGRSLADSGVLDGAVLIFQDIGSWSGGAAQTAPALPEASASDRGIAVGGIGIRWNREGLLN